MILILVDKNTKKRTSVSYPKYLLELHLGRYLTKFETVDHIDGNPLNNEIRNLRILSRSIHSKNDTKKLVPIEFICPVCGNRFVLGW